MGFFDRPEEKATQAHGSGLDEKTPDFRIHMPGAPDGTFVPLGKSQINRKFEKERGARLLIIVDEVAELLMPSGVKSEAGKQIDAQKQEINSIIQSITQLGRSAGVHMILCTQRNDAPIKFSYKLTVIRDKKEIRIKWDELQIGDTFDDGSICTNIGEWINEDCFELVSDLGKLEASQTHLLKVTIKNEKGEELNEKISGQYPLSAVLRAQRELNTTWFAVGDLADIIKKYSVYNYNGDKITSIRFIEENAKCRCIQTNKGTYDIKGFISHNSIIPGVTQSNSLVLDTKLTVKRKV